MTVDFDKLHGLTGTLSKKKERELKRKISYMQLDVELSKRVSHAQGLVYDKFDGLNEGSRAKIDLTKTIAKGSIESGATSVEVENSEGFKKGQEVTVYDNESIERPILADVRKIGNQITHEVVDATVKTSDFDLSGNGGRKLIQLDNGWLVSSVMTASRAYIGIFISKDNGSTWTRIYSLGTGGTNSLYDSSISYKNNTIYAVVSAQYAGGGRGIHFIALDSDRETSETIRFDDSRYTLVDTAQSEIGNVSLIINKEGTELHAVWSSKNATYPNSFNIRYSKGTINADGSVTWGTVEQVTNHNSTSYPNAWVNPTIILDRENTPTILAESSLLMLSNGQGGNFNPNCRINIVKKSSELGYSFLNGWTGVTVYDGGVSYTQSNPSAIFVPSEINGLPQGRIWVAWHGRESASNFDNIRVSYSDDGGISWSAMQRLTGAGLEVGIYSSYRVSITANKDNIIYLLFHSVEDSAVNDVKNTVTYQIKNVDGIWGSKTKVTSSRADYVSSLVDLSLNFTEPLFIYQDVTNSRVGFYGKWTEGAENHFLDFEEPLTKSFKEKAGIARTNAEIKDGELVFGTWRGQGFVIKEVN